MEALEKAISGNKELRTVKIPVKNNYLCPIWVIITFLDESKMVVNQLIILIWRKNSLNLDLYVLYKEEQELLFQGSYKVLWVGSKNKYFSYKLFHIHEFQ